ncbi:RNA methyltransferase [Microlunatus sp. Gsoil 973]|uniref:TrmH family RNA methyltransferase n=1 Tax=Microlunatus sp. Gsoil 973 TaxID=2672569 RepID=UPI001E3572D6|nr:RNA methyltransferase [Microlunatus sp. Gsoil 973]
MRRKERLARDEFLAEGPQAVREALAADRPPRTVLVTRRAAERHTDLVDAVRRAGLDPSLITEDQLGAVTDSTTPQGIVAICPTLDVGLETALAGRPRLIVCCAEIRDPGNAGTVIRCADAAGADAVILGSASVDLYNPKTVRASTGSIFHLPVVTNAELEVALDRCRQQGLQVLAAAGGGAYGLDELLRSGDLAAPTVWLMGNEARGLHPDQLELADRVVSVPIYGAAESLNLSTAAAVCLYASAFAQRSGEEPGPAEQ